MHHQKISDTITTTAGGIVPVTIPVVWLLAHKIGEEFFASEAYPPLKLEFGSRISRVERVRGKSFLHEVAVLV